MKFYLLILWIFWIFVFCMGVPSIKDYDPKPVMIPYNESFIEKPRYSFIEFHGHLINIEPERVFREIQKMPILYFIDLSVRVRNLKEYEEHSNRFSQILDKLLIFPALNWKRLEEDNSIHGIQKMANDLEEIAKNKKIRGIKIWKDFGLLHRKKDGTFWKLDDPEFDILWGVCKKYNLIVAIHTADPPAFFQPPDLKNERILEISRNPQWSFYDNFPSFENLMKQRENLFRRRRDIIFVTLHFGEYAHDLKKAEELLKDHPNVYLDIAQRIDELGRQPYSAREFFIKYQDRILYGTDGSPDYEKSKIYWRFLETKDEYFDYKPAYKPRKGIWRIYGIDLPDEVLKKIYYQNAEKLLREKK